MASPKGGTPIEGGIISRLARGVSYALSGKSANDFFGPGQPIPPAAQEQAHGRAFDYETNYNISTRPRGNEPIDFKTLRALADSYDLVRLAIETRKDQMGKLRWQVTRKDNGKEDKTSKAIQDFLQEPDGEHDFLDWSRMLYEDLLVIDAPAVYIHPTLGGDVFALEQIDGATITRKLDGRGRTPAPPKEGETFDPTIHTAYQQIIKGLPATNYHRDELIYRPRNPRVHKVYGFSPVEQIIVIVNIGLRRQAHQLAFYTAGNIPEMLMSTPATWTPDMIDKFQKLWNQLMAGDLEARRQLKFVPGDVKAIPLRPETSLFDPFDEWLARVVSYCFSLPPNAFVKQQNRATAANAQEVATEEGLAPLMEWKVRLMNSLIRKAWKTDDYQFSWLDEDSTDPLVQAQVDQIYVTTKIRLPNEIRDDHGWPQNPELDKLALAPPPAPIAPAKPGSEDDGSKEKSAAAEKLMSGLIAQIQAVDARVTESTGAHSADLVKLLDAVSDMRSMITDLQKADPSTPIPTASQMADALAKMVDTGVPLNKALASVGFDFTVPGGDVGLVSAARIPLDMATDARGFEPVIEKVEKRAPEPAPAPQPITITVPIHIDAPEPGKAVHKESVMTRNADGTHTTITKDIPVTD